MTTAQPRQVHSRSVRRRILVPIGILLIVELALLCATVLGGGLLSKLDDAARSTLRSRVNSRATYLQTEMTGRWGNLDHATAKINTLYAELCAAGTLTPETLVTDPAQYSALLTAAAPTLIEMMRIGGVTGTMLVLNDGGYATGTLSQDEIRPCIYLRDRDPISTYNAKNGDLLFEYAPIATAKAVPISCDSGWMPMMRFAAGDTYPDYLAMPNNAAMQTRTLSAALCGYWSAPHTLEASNELALTYTVPLIAEDGSVYGTLGIELLVSYLQKLLPAGELNDDGNGLYALYTASAAPAADGSSTKALSLLSSPTYEASLNVPAFAAALPDNDEDFGQYAINANTLYLCAQPLTLYDSTSPFADTQWLLAGGLEGNVLYAAADATITTLALSLLLMGLACVYGMLIISRLVTRPLELLSAQVHSSVHTQPIVLQRTGITEVDTLAKSVEDMSIELFRSADKFSRIVRMSSINVGGFEYNENDNTLFINDNFFRVFGLDTLNATSMTPEQFKEQMHMLDGNVVSKEYNADTNVEEYIYAIHRAGDTLWTRLRLVRSATAWLGLVEDVTAERRELEKVAFERDHDVLTGLLNRRSWTRNVNLLFTAPPQLKVSALLMLDLDNLKFINDTYGHDAGDTYICTAAEALSTHAPANTVVCRKSGDEFLAFLYGYDTQEALRTAILLMQKQFRATSLVLQNGSTHLLRASGGIAWYPTDTNDLGNLLRYADFAMYKAKRNIKGDFCEFDIDTYRRESFLFSGTESLNKMIANNLVDYHFQPIVDAATGEVFAYEALMRPRVEDLRSPDNVLALARREGLLAGIERMTWFSAMSAFVQHRRQGLVGDKCRVFINSIPDRRMTDADVTAFEEHFRPYLSLIVQEHTEDEHLDDACLHFKQSLIATWGAADALDDYGSGFNNEKTLLSVRTEFIKLDISLISGIDSDAVRRQLVANLIQLADANGSRIVAEGVETQAEMETLIELGVDYLQGYYLARPALIPPLIPQELSARIQTLARGRSAL